MSAEAKSTFRNRILTLIVSAIVFATAIPAMATSILWWNVGGANFLKPTGYTYDRSQLEENLLSLVQFQDPEFVVLGEYYEGFFSEATVLTLKRKYPHSRHFRNNRASKLGIVVFSKEEFSIYEIFEGLRWKSGTVEQNRDRAHPNHLRSYQELGIRRKDGSELRLVPLHTAMPWEEVISNREGLSRFNDLGPLGKIPGKIDAGLGVLYGTENPLVHQIEEFLRIFKARRSASPKATWVVFGDLNVIDRFYGIDSECFDSLKRELNPSTNVGNVKHSFPAPNTHKSSEVLIDHALSNLNSEDLKTRILKVPGSDHFPMTVSF